MISGLLAFLLLASIAASAQLEVGDYVKMNLTGNLGVGYTGAFGSEGVLSGHSVGFQSDANLNGYYFHPSFLSFNIRPYFDRQQSNSESQIITRGTGIGGQVGLFGGSHFPGSLSFNQDFSNNSLFTIAGVPSVIGDTNGRNFGVTWSALVPNYPTVQVSYASGHSTSTVSGLMGESDTSSKSLTLNSSYLLAGFNLQGNINKYWSHFTTPGFLTPTPVESGGSSTSYAISAQHRMPLNGSFGLGVGHATFEGDDDRTWSANNYTANAGIRPWQRLSLNQTLTYTTNLSAYLAQSLNGIGSEMIQYGADTKGLYLNSMATLRLFKGLSLNGYFNHRDQTLNSREYSDSQYGGTLSYNYRSPLFGILYFGFGLVDTANKVGNQGMGLVANVGMNKKFGGWDTSADFNYQQNVQTLGTTSTTSAYNYGGSIRRRFNTNTYITGSARTSHTAIVLQEGEGNRAESFGASFAWRRWSWAATYSQSNGTAILTSSGGLIAAPEAPLISDGFLFFNAKSYAFTVTTNPLRRLTLTGGYINFFSGTEQSLAGVTNAGDRYNARLEYRLRKFSIIGGFTRSMQDISTASGGPRVVNSYYLSLNRWFNLF